ncbi:thioesterase domain-containing protein [Nonomuraea typhae]|uniref:Thioesterase domain-containing protein n=1 Tax=Nonomuraea typhae TaxID=2603600 RepID=A0ABW7Z725_9ACTN
MTTEPAAVDDGFIELHEPEGVAPLLPLRLRGSRPPLFCVHPVGGLSWCYAGLTGELDPEIPVYGLQSRDAAPTAEQMAESHLERITTVQPQGPYRLLGWSFGGTLAHEIAVRLREEGEKIGLLALLDAGPGSARAERAGVDPERALLEASGNEAGPHGVPAALATLRERHGFTQEQVTAMVGMCAHNAELAARHRSRRFDGDLMVFTARGGAGLNNAWRRHVSGAIDHFPIDSDHRGMLGSDAAARIARILANPLRGG